MDLCLLLHDTDIPEWQADALRHLIEHGDATVTAIVYDESDRTRTRLETLKRGMKLREWAVIGTLNEVLFSSTSRDERVAIGSIVDRESALELSVEPTVVDGWKREIPAEAVETAAAEADLAIRFGFGFVVGPVLTAFEHGVLSYHHGDLREYRGQPMGFWEFVHGRDTAGITVQKLTDELDAGRIAALKTVQIDDLDTWEGIKRRLLEESEDMLSTAVETLREGEAREPEVLGEVYTHPKGLPVATFAVKNARGHLLEYVDGFKIRPGKGSPARS